MEAKLKEFKSRRRREILLNKPKQLLNDILDRFSFKNDTLQENVKSPLVGEESPGNTPRVSIKNLNHDYIKSSTQLLR